MTWHPHTDLPPVAWEANYHELTRLFLTPGDPTATLPNGDRCTFPVCDDCGRCCGACRDLEEREAAQRHQETCPDPDAETWIGTWPHAGDPEGSVRNHYACACGEVVEAGLYYFGSERYPDGAA